VGIILLWVIVGLVAGWLASKVLHSPHGILMDLVLGIVGSLLGGWVVRVIFEQHGPFADARAEQFRAASQSLTWTTESVIVHIVVAALGAMLLIVLHRLLVTRRGLRHA
jgi:uncharacterized membrane protein YeaQ/YmgE (transglycosylase-associated protein family)